MLGAGIFSLLSLAATCLAGEISARRSGDVVVQTRNLPGTSDADTISAIHSRLTKFARQDGGQTFTATGNISKSWTNFPLASENQAVDINCVNCYFKAAATFELTVTERLDFFNKAITNTTKNVIKAMKDVGAEKIIEIFGGDGGDSDTLNFSSIIPTISAVELDFRLDELDAFLTLQTKFDSSDLLEPLVVPLLDEPSPLDIEIPGLNTQAFISVDLVLDGQSESLVDLTNGIHVKITPPLGFKLELFSPEVAEVELNGAKFEFLPVIVRSENLSFSATLRVGLYTGIELDLGTVAEVAGVTAGIRAGAFVNVAEFATEVKSKAEGGKGCDQVLRNVYTLGVGAQAAATLAQGTLTLGLEPFINTDIFVTSLPTECATSSALPKTTKPAKTTTAVSTTSFGRDALNIKATSGPPKEFDGDRGGDEGGSGNTKKVALGLVLGLVLPLFLGLVAWAVYVERRKKLAAKNRAAQKEWGDQFYAIPDSQGGHK